MIAEVFDRYVPLVEEEMRRVLQTADGLLAGHYGMLRYHMGWANERFEPAQVSSGKRIRPVLCLLACQAVRGSLASAVPAAAALELVHNFSLIHDDIEDDSPTRRHRPTVWALWGRPQAINAGDAMFTLARLALARLHEHGLPAARVLEAFRLFDQACLRLTEGQYLDMSFETRLDVTVDEYLAMVDGKTAALLAASLNLGALIGDAAPQAREHLAVFGRSLGLAFQIQDDILGIWGDEVLLGKSAESDILTRKKSLPVIHALQHPQVGAAMRALYEQPIGVEAMPAVLNLLAEAGAQAYAAQAAQSAHQRALEALDASGVLAADNQAGRALLAISEMLAGRSH